MTEQQKRYAEIVKDYADKTPWVWCVYLFEEFGGFKPRYIIVGSEAWLPNWTTK